ncbi:hypothetical protein [Rhodopseudomonas sp. B29]|uniref:hypothetical protein n=1 Tax=Rhodopseudomonas sp. B29 TaxID=95607 RepID=UPI000593AB51|nr:hypothetical protein [Rhodopseudomonas sp. B29]
MSNALRSLSDQSSDHAAVIARNKLGTAKVVIGNLRRSADLPGEMALQNMFGHHATQSVPQKLVRLVGYRDPAQDRPI